jgi:hypothetical protein
MKKNMILSAAAVCLLISAGLIYICFRPATITLFRFLDFVGFDYMVFQNNSINPPSFLIYNFTNALFIIFACIFTAVIWGNDKFHYFFYASLITAANIVYEILTRDIGDIITITITFIICSSVYMMFVRDITVKK